MNETICLLGIDDDNHCISFFGLNGEYFYSGAELIQKLAKPHAETYECRVLTMVDFDDDEVMDDCCYIDSFHHNKNSTPAGTEKFRRAFERMWSKADPERFYI